MNYNYNEKEEGRVLLLWLTTATVLLSMMLYVGCG